MAEPAYYYLAEVEEMFRIGRDTLIRWARAGIFELQGENRGRRATGASVRAAYQRLEQGEDVAPRLYLIADLWCSTTSPCSRGNC